MAEEYRRADANHHLILEGREKATISGVTDVISFNETEIVMETVRGQLTVVGEELHVEKLSLDIGELMLEGVVDAIAYADERRQKGSFWSRFF